jgi:hypothetical protein
MVVESARVPPHDLEAERSALGGVLIKPSTVETLIAGVDAHDFFLPAHREIFEALQVLHERKDAIDVVTLNNVLKARGALPHLEGAESYILRLADTVPTAENIGHYIDIVKETSTLRRLITATAEIQARAYSGEASSEELVASMTSDATKLATDGRISHWLDAEFQTVGQLGLLDRDAPPREYLLHAGQRGILPYGRVGMLAAAGGSGKSWILIHLAVAVATGRDWIGTFSVNPKKRGRVLLLLAEEEMGEFHRRLELACADLAEGYRQDVRDNIIPLTLSGRDIELVRSGDKFDKSVIIETKNYRRLLRLVNDGGPWALIIFDPLTRLASDAENDNGAASRLITLFERFTQAPGTPNVIFAHHITKSSHQRGSLDATAARGAGALNNNARWQAILEPRAHFEGAPTIVDFRIVKSNYAPTGQPVALQVDRDRSGMLVPATEDVLAAWNAFRLADKEGSNIRPIGTAARAAAGDDTMTRARRLLGSDDD